MENNELITGQDLPYIIVAQWHLFVDTPEGRSFFTCVFWTRRGATVGACIFSAPNIPPRLSLSLLAACYFSSITCLCVLLANWLPTMLSGLSVSTPRIKAVSNSAPQRLRSLSPYSGLMALLLGLRGCDYHGWCKGNRIITTFVDTVPVTILVMYTLLKEMTIK